MNTPIYNFVKTYKDLRPARFHMPGHKGRGPLGCEDLDLTEIPGADSLYEAAGIIAESEANASALFGCPTFYSTEGSSHCIRAMLLLAAQATGTSASSAESPVGSRCESRTAMPEATSHAFGRLRQQATGKAFPLRGRWHPASPASRMTDEVACDPRFRVLAARNVHSAFLTAAALLDLDVVWLPAERPAAGGKGSYLSAHPTPEVLDAALAETGAAAVYLTCPDYLGELPELRPLAAVCHARGALLLVDNAHGAYLRFLRPSRHPMDLGADLCCDSAHKTLPVLTGGAYLHVRETLVGAAVTSPACRGGGPASRPVEGCRPPKATSIEMQNAKCRMQNEDVRDVLSLFGSTSPSYLILQSLDLANPYLETLPETLADFLPKVEALKKRLRAAGWTLTGDEPLKLTLELSPVGTSIACPPSGSDLAAALEQEGIFCEFADPEHVVFLLSPSNTDEELARLEAALNAVGSDPLIAPVIAGGNDAAATRRQEASRDASLRFCSNTGDGSLCCAVDSSFKSPVREHREPSPVSKSPVSNQPAAATDATSSVTASPCHLPLKGKAMREAMLSPAVRVPAGESLGRVLARPGVSCPPAVPILMPGEVIDKNAIEAFEKYGIEEVSVLL